MGNTSEKHLAVSPHISVDCVVLGYDGRQLRVLLISRKEPGPAADPLPKKLPGSLIYLEEDLDEAAQRVLFELTGIKNVPQFQFHAFGSKDRSRNPKDVQWLSRFHQLASDVERIVTVGYFSLLKIGPRFRTLSSHYEACWVPFEEVGELAFDHNQIISYALRHMRQYAENNPNVLFELLPRKFTIAELRHLFEVIYDRSYDVRNFHKKVALMDYIVPLDEHQTGVAHRAARYYRFDKVKYNQSFRTIN